MFQSNQVLVKLFFLKIEFLICSHELIFFFSLPIPTIEIGPSCDEWNITCNY